MSLAAVLPRVLLIEDEPAFALALTAELRKLDVSLDVARTAAEGFEKLAHSAYSFVLVDLILPDLDGFSVCRTIRAQGRRGFGLVLVTASDVADFERQAFEAGADDCFTKSGGAEIVARRVRNLIALSAGLVDHSVAPILERITAGIVGLDHKMRVTFINAEAERLLEVQAGDIIGADITVHRPELCSRMQRVMEASLQSGRPETLEVESTRLGRWFDVRLFPSPTGISLVFLDVTVRRVREQRLRLLETAITHANDIVLITDGQLEPPGPHIIYANPAFERVTGHRVDEVIGQSPRILQGPETAREQLAALRADLAAARPAHAELLNYGRDGRRFWLELDIVPVREGGETTHFVSLQRDVTARKEAEARLRENEQLYRTLFDEHPYPMWIIARDDLRFLEVNDAATRLYGYSRAEFLSMTLHKIKSPAGIATTREIMQQSGERRRTVLHIKKDGSVVEVQNVSRELRWRGVEARLAVLIDLTERRRAEQTQAQLAAIVESSDDAVMGLTGEGIVTSWNGAAVKLFGFSADEILGQSANRLIPPELLEQEVAFRARAAAGERIPRRESRRMHRSGRVFPVSLTMWPVVSRAGEIGSVAVTLRDVSREHALTAELLQAQKLDAVGRLAGGVVHDFNNVLSAIQTSAELARELLGGINLDVDEELAAVTDAVKRGAALTRQLLAFTRRDAAEPRILRVDEAVRGVERLLRRLIPENVRLTAVCESSAQVLIDPTHFEQVLVNLVVNGRDAMPSGGELTIRCSEVTDPASVPVALEGGAKVVLLTVADTGLGMDEATRARAFEPFFTTKERNKGSGLGLSTVYGIVQRYGGKVWIDSTPGRGTAVHIALPTTDKAPEPPAPGLDELPRAGSGLVLLCEDDDSVRGSVQRLLAAHGYQVVTASTAAEALRLQRSGLRPDVLLSDVVMPGGSGYELTRAARERQPDLPVLLMTGYQEEALPDDLVGKVTLVRKPFGPATVLTRLGELLARR